MLVEVLMLLAAERVPELVAAVLLCSVVAVQVPQRVGWKEAAA